MHPCECTSVSESMDIERAKKIDERERIAIHNEFIILKTYTLLNTIQRVEERELLSTWSFIIDSLA